MKITMYGIAGLFLFVAVSSLADDSPLLAIDVGHSISQSGARSARGKSEFEFNKVLARTIHEALSSRQISSFLIGDDGMMTSLDSRTSKAGKKGATFFLSVHHDSVQPKYLETWEWQYHKRKHVKGIFGFSLFVSRKNPNTDASLDCARHIGAAMKSSGFKPSPHHAEQITGESREWADQDNGVYYFDDLIVLKTAKSPAVLLEAGVIVNREEEITIQDPFIRNAIATAVVQGLMGCHAIHADFAKKQEALDEYQQLLAIVDNAYSNQKL